MKMLSTAIAAVLALSAGALAQEEGAHTVIHAGHLIAVPGEDVREDVTIHIRGDRIESIEDGFVSPDGATVIDLSDDWVMPGFIDSHVHLLSQQGPLRRFEGFILNPAAAGKL